MDERAPVPGPAEPARDDPASRVREVLEAVAEAMGVEGEVQVDDGPDEIAARVSGEDVGVLIGHHGTTIDAIQHLAYRIAFRGGGSRKRVSVDAGGYRERREGALHAAADQAASAATRDAKPVVLEAMSATERRVVHEHLKDRGDIETYSQGEEPDRRLVVAPIVD